MISFIQINLKNVDKIKELWQELNEHHVKKASYFRNEFIHYTFDDRINNIISKVNGEDKIHIDLVIDEKENKPIGYCITTINGKSVGEIDSIYVNINYRGRKIGETLMERATNWLDMRGIEKQVIGVVEGNEEVLQFYSRFDFYPKVHILKRDR